MNWNARAIVGLPCWASAFVPKPPTLAQQIAAALDAMRSVTLGELLPTPTIGEMLSGLRIGEER